MVEMYIDAKKISKPLFVKKTWASIQTTPALAAIL